MFHHPHHIIPVTFGRTTPSADTHINRRHSIFVCNNTLLAVSERRLPTLLPREVNTQCEQDRGLEKNARGVCKARDRMRSSSCAIIMRWWLLAALAVLLCCAPTTRATRLVAGNDVVLVAERRLHLAYIVEDTDIMVKKTCQCIPRRHCLTANMIQLTG